MLQSTYQHRQQVQQQILAAAAAAPSSKAHDPKAGEVDMTCNCNSDIASSCACQFQQVAFVSLSIRAFTDICE
jgi:hypothetical protein